MVRLAGVLIGLLVLVLPVAGCGGGDGETAAETEPAVVTVEPEVQQATTPSEAAETGESGASQSGSGEAPAAGSGTLVLDDGRTFPISVTECSFDPNGTFSVDGSGPEGSVLDMGQFYLGDNWSQTQVALEFPNRDQIYVIVSRATPDGEPAEVDGKTVSWTETFRELDESANAHVYTGEGTVTVTCP